MKQVKAWRDAATLIIAAKTKDASMGCNYKVLCMKRSEKTSFMKNNLSFPGGGIEKQDENIEWLKYFQKTGTASQLKNLQMPMNPPVIFENQEGLLQRTISLRIAAIRETFEELGVLICKEVNNPNASGFYRGIDVKHYQNLVHDHKITFLDMCKELNVIPDLWRLHVWSNWLTPTFFAHRRFNTIFFIMTLQEQPPATPEVNEAFSYMWRTPSEYLEMSKDEVFLPPPQFYEFSRLRNVPDLDKLQEFIKSREQNEIQLMMPVQYICSDGMVMTLPGDDAYPKPVQYVEDPETTERQVSQTLDEFKETKNLHRTVIRGPHNILIQMSIEPFNGHLSPNFNTLKL